ncbi:MAG: hypothetical protein AAFS10_13720, partial [Myxococcota bacterium]
MFRLSSLLKWVGWLIERQFRMLLLLSTPLWLVLMMVVGVHLLTSTTTFRGALVFFLDDLFDGRMDLQELRWSADLRYLQLYGVELYESNGERVFSIDSLRAQLDLTSLPLGQLRIERVDAAGADVLVHFDDRGGFNVIDALSTGPASLD